MILAALGTGEIVAIILSVFIVFLIVAIVVFLKLKKKNIDNNLYSHECINPTLLNSKLLEEVTVEKIKPNMVAVVPPTHSAILIRNGEMVNVYSGCDFTLCDSEITKIHSLKVIYISKTVKLTVRWGTKIHQRFEYIDPKINKPVSVGAFGVTDIRVANPSKFYLEMVANFGQTFNLEDLEERIRTSTADDTVRAISQVFKTKKISYVDFNSEKYDIQTQVCKILSDKYINKFGFEICDFIIESINLPDDQIAEIKKIYSEDSAYDRAESVMEREHKLSHHSMELIDADSELEDRLYKRKTDRIREQQEYERKVRHEEEDRAWAREDKERDSKISFANNIISAYKDIAATRNDENSVSTDSSVLTNAGHHCSVCGSAYKPNAKYCPGCGAIIPNESVNIVCSGCGNKVSWGTAYCPLCGTKICN